MVIIYIVLSAQCTIYNFYGSCFTRLFYQNRLFDEEEREKKLTRPSPPTGDGTEQQQDGRRSRDPARHVTNIDP